MSTPWKILFLIFYYSFLFFSKIKSVYGYIHKYVFIPLFYHQNKLLKIQQYINTLNKKPQAITLSIKLSNKPNQKQQFIYLLETIQTTYPETIHIFFNGEPTIVQEFQQFTSNFLKNTSFNDSNHQNTYDVSPIIIIKQIQLYSTLPKPTSQPKVPLIISMTDCKTVNNLPYPYLVNGQIGFCPPLMDCGRSDIVHCFEQYANSKQRHGK